VFVYFLNGILRAALRPIAVGTRLQISFKDRFQHQFGGVLSHSIPYGRDSLSSLL
jgi:hypothetical protein